MLLHRALSYLAITFSMLAAVPVAADTVSDPLLPDRGRALSLRVLQERAKACQRNGNCEEAVTHLAFLRRIDGFVLDPEHRDLVLFGQVDQSWPKLHVQDLVIALRDAWHLYGRRIGNTVYRSNPGVSIDPNPQVIKRLQEIGSVLNGLADGADLDRGLESWHQVCHLPQRVRVEGIPSQTRFADTMLKVDYDLKRIADGSVDFTLDGFQSLSARYLEAAKQALNEGAAAQLSTMSRFWFYPKPLKVRADETAALIVPPFGLKVLTEEEHLNKRGQIKGKGTGNPHAEAFANSVSDLIPRIAQSRPVWRELDNLAWMVALARTIRYRRALEQSGLDLVWLLNNFAMTDTQVPETVPGHSNVQRYDYQQAISYGYVVGTLRLPSCGGVEMDIKVDEKTFLSANRRLRGVYRHVNISRPDSNVLYWDF